MQVTIGCDPEMFLVDPLMKTPRPAHDTIPGNKQAPYPVLGGAIQVDGMAVEVNINPARTRKEFMDNINTVMAGLSDNLGPMYQIAHGIPYMDFGPDGFEGLPPEATELGCEPDYNAYTMKANPRPEGTVTFRTAAGHIHLGWEANAEDPYSGKHFQLCCDIARNMDYYVGIYALLWDQDNRRRSLYGKAGAFRAKSYGLEYRTPSTAWLASEHLQAWVFDASVKCVEDYFNGIRPYDVYGDQARIIIDENIVDWQQVGYDFQLGMTEPYIAQAA